MIFCMFFCGWHRSFLLHNLANQLRDGIEISRFSRFFNGEPFQKLVVIFFDPNAHHGRFFESPFPFLSSISRHFRKGSSIVRTNPSAIGFAKALIQIDELNAVAIFGLRPHVLIELDEGVLPLWTDPDAASAVTPVTFGVFVVTEHLHPDPGFVFLGFCHLVGCHDCFLFEGQN